MRPNRIPTRVAACLAALLALAHTAAAQDAVVVDSSRTLEGSYKSRRHTNTGALIGLAVGGFLGLAYPRQLRGTISGNKVSLATQVQARRNINGEESVQTMTIVYDFTVDGDKLEGTTTNKAPDMEMPARPFSAWRETQPRS